MPDNISEQRGGTVQYHWNAIEEEAGALAYKEGFLVAALAARDAIRLVTTAFQLTFEHFYRRSKPLPPAPYKPLTWIEVQALFERTTLDGELTTGGLPVLFGEDNPAFQSHQVWPPEAFAFYLSLNIRKGL